MLTVKEVSKMTGVSIRTLHYYDDINLLKPIQITKAGYRLYDNTSLIRLQNILMFRELQFPLKEIKKILDSPDFDSRQALEQQIKLLELQKIHIEEIISLAHKIKIEGGDNMNFNVFKNTEFNKYAEEVKEKWGATDQYREYKQKNKNEQELEENAKQMMDLFKEIGSLKQLPVESKAVQDKIKALQEFITNNYYNCTNEILKGLGQMYVSDERFKKNIDKAGGEGTAEFVKRAILVYCSK